MHAEAPGTSSLTFSILANPRRATQAAATGLCVHVPTDGVPHHPSFGCEKRQQRLSSRLLALSSLPASVAEVCR